MAKTEKRDRAASFALAYVANGGNGSDAARKAGYSPNGAGVAAVRLLRKANVVALIESEQQILNEKYRLTTANTLRSLEQALFFDPRKLYNPDGSLKDIVDLDEATAMALQGIECDVTVDKRGKITMSTKRVKWLDRNTARDQALKILGKYKADTTPADDPLVAATDRAAKGMEGLQAQFLKVLAKHSGAKP